MTAPPPAELRERAESGLGGPPTAAWFVPGRIEFLGKHTDYAGGRSLVCATEQGFALVARPRHDPVLRVSAAGAADPAELPFDPALRIPTGSWVAYPATVVRRLARDFGPLEQGLDLSLASNLPRDAGLSSSSALVVGIALAIAELNRLGEQPRWRAAFPDDEALAGYLGAVENGKAFGPLAADGGVGTMGGTQDHTAILCARPGMLCQYGFDPVRFERAVPVPAGYGLAVAVSGVIAAKTREALALYNARAEAVQRLLAVWRQATGRDDPTLYAAIVSAPGASRRLAGLLRNLPDAERLSARLAQFTAECEELIPAVGDALARGDVAALGPLVDRSQEGAERGLENQVAETIQLQRSARRLGAVAASAFGAGFGGSVWAMIELTRAPEFLLRWSATYFEAFPAHREHARFLSTAAGGPATRLA